MREIFHSAKSVLMWLSPDTQGRDASTAVESIRRISESVFEKLDVSLSDLRSAKSVYQDILFSNRGRLPLLNESGLGSDGTWRSLAWFYSHPLFTRVWAIQEVNANTERVVHCGHQTIDWHLVELVAGYIILETAFSRQFGFTGAYCWWAANVATERFRAPQNWIFMLYLASNFSTTDKKDLIYGLRGLMSLGSDAAERLLPDYSKSTVEVYRDSVEAAFVDFGNVDVLLYASGNDDPSWIPRWDRPMLFRNPFRFGKSLPWKPAGASKAVWHISKASNVLSLTGFCVDVIKTSESYNEQYFGNAMLASEEGKSGLQLAWRRILGMLDDARGALPQSPSAVTAAAMSLSFGLDENSDPADVQRLTRYFVAYLRLVLDPETFARHVSPELSEEASRGANGHEFGKPVWDFAYPDSSIFVTQGGLVGCGTATTRPGDVIFVARGGTYPFVLRPDGEHFFLRGYAFVHGVMRGERQSSTEQVVQIR